MIPEDGAVVTGPRDEIICIPQSTASHAAKHWGESAAVAGEKLIEICTAPDRIYPNHSNRANQRTGKEVYLRREANSGGYVAVPMMVTEDGYRIATTCYTKESLPHGRAIWTRPINR